MIKSLSIILPLYNEEKRLRKSLKKIANFLKTKKIQYIEIIFVDDGSIDKSSQIILQFIKNFNKKKFIKLQLVKYRKNQGKGHGTHQIARIKKPIQQKPKKRQRLKLKLLSPKRNPVKRFMEAEGDL